MKYLLSLVAICLISHSSMAQYKVASTSVSGKKTTTTTQYIKGYVEKLDGQRLEGLIQLKVVNNDTVEVRYKDEAKNKTKFSRYDINSFGPILLAKDQGLAKNAAKNFNQGYVVTQAGDRIDAKVALRYSLSDDPDQLNRKWFVQRALVDTGDGKYKIYTAKDLSLISQIVDGKQSIYELYKDGFSKRLSDGALVLMQNPYSTTENSFASGLADNVQEEVAKEIAKAEVKRAVEGKSGSASLDDIQKNYEENSSGAATINQKEFLVRFANSQEVIVLNKKAFDDWVEQTYASCAAYRALDKSEQKRFARMGNIKESIDFYNANCGK